MTLELSTIWVITICVLLYTFILLWIVLYDNKKRFQSLEDKIKEMIK